MSTLKWSQIAEESNDEKEERTVGLQESYNSLLEKTCEYVKVAKAAIKKMEKAEQDYTSLLVQYKETKCEIKTLNGELTKAYLKIKFLDIYWYTRSFSFLFLQNPKRGTMLLCLNVPSVNSSLMNCFSNV